MELNDIIKSGSNVMLVVSSGDLMRFANLLIEKAQQVKADEHVQQRKDDRAEEQGRRIIAIRAY